MARLFKGRAVLRRNIIFPRRVFLSARTRDGLKVGFQMFEGPPLFVLTHFLRRSCKLPRRVPADPSSRRARLPTRPAGAPQTSFQRPSPSGHEGDVLRGAPRGFTACVSSFDLAE